MRLILHTAAYWLLHTLRAAAPKRSSWRTAEFTTLGLRLIKIAARVVEGAARIRLWLPDSLPGRGDLPAARRPLCRSRTMSHGAMCPAEPVPKPPTFYRSNCDQRGHRRHGSARPYVKNL